MKLEQSIIGRRQFLDGMICAGAAGLGAAGVYTAMGSLIGVEEPEPAEAILSGAQLETLARERFVLVPFGPAPVIVFTLPDGTLRALSGLCTHSRCNVSYRPAENDLYCACHHGRYTNDGTNVPGTPPPRPLRRYLVEKLDDGTLRVQPMKKPDETSKA